MHSTRSIFFLQNSMEFRVRDFFFLRNPQKFRVSCGCCTQTKKASGSDMMYCTHTPGTGLNFDRHHKSLGYRYCFITELTEVLRHCMGAVRHRQKFQVGCNMRYPYPHPHRSTRAIPVPRVFLHRCTELKEVIAERTKIPGAGTCMESLRSPRLHGTTTLVFAAGPLG